MFFNNERQKMLEDQFKTHTEKEEHLFTKLFESLTGIRDEIHKINECQMESNAAHTLAIIKAKQDVLETCFDRLLEKKRYEREMNEIRDELDGKLDTKTARLVWGIVSLLAASAAWVLNAFYGVGSV